MHQKPICFDIPDLVQSTQLHTWHQALTSLLTHSSHVCRILQMYVSPLQMAEKPH